MPSVLRICLNENGTFMVFPWIGSPNEGDYEPKPLPTLEALILMTRNQIPVEIATNDPSDYAPHNYETLKTLTLSRI